MNYVLFGITAVLWLFSTWKVWDLSDFYYEKRLNPLQAFLIVPYDLIKAIRQAKKAVRFAEKNHLPEHVRSGTKSAFVMSIIYTLAFYLPILLLVILNVFK
ncbi:MAG: hypothetical protein ACP5D6_07365 [Kosmotogaceae bacterium]|jgi:hypothetical protein